MRWLASDKGTCFKQEELLGLDEEDIWHPPNIVSFILLPFEAIDGHLGYTDTLNIFYFICFVSALS